MTDILNPSTPVGYKDNNSKDAGNMIISQPNNLFMVGSTYAPGAGTKAGYQLWNPAASGVNLIIQHTSLYLDSAGSLNIYKSTAALTTIDPVYTPTNMNFGDSATPQAELRYEDDSAPPGLFSLIPLPSGRNVPGWNFAGTVITPGKGLTFKNGIADQKIKPMFTWTEVAVS